MKRYPLAELPFMSVQGEGARIGKPSVFFRFAGCDNRCKWCDTAYAQSTREEDVYIRYTSEEMLRYVIGTDLDAVLTGGNPVIHDLTELVSALQCAGRYVLLETQGSVLPVPKWVEWVNMLSLSPKPPSSGNPTPTGNIREYVRVLSPLTDWYVKIAVDVDADWAYVREVSGEVQTLLGELYLQPVAHRKDSAEDLLAKYRRLCNAALSDRTIRVRGILPQMHRLAWGNERRV